MHAWDGWTKKLTVSCTVSTTRTAIPTDPVHVEKDVEESDAPTLHPLPPPVVLALKSTLRAGLSVLMPYHEPTSRKGCQE